MNAERRGGAGLEVLLFPAETKAEANMRTALIFPLFSHEINRPRTKHSSPLWMPARYLTLAWQYRNVFVSLSPHRGHVQLFFGFCASRASCASGKLLQEAYYLGKMIVSREQIDDPNNLRLVFRFKKRPLARVCAIIIVGCSLPLQRGKRKPQRKM